MPRIGNTHDCSKGLSTLQLTIFPDEKLTIALSSLGSQVAYAAIAPLSSPQPHQHFWFSLFSDYNHRSEHEVVFPGILICISLLIDTVEHLVTYFVTGISSLEKYPLK